MTVIVTLLLAILSLAFVAYPLLKQRSRPTDSFEDAQLPEVYSERDATYSAIKELEFDFRSGSLSAKDYHDLDASYKRKAISILKKIDDLKKDSTVEDEIEMQVMEMRQAKGPFCPQCGARCQDSDRFCSRCGTSLSQEERVD